MYNFDDAADIYADILDLLNATLSTLAQLFAISLRTKVCVKSK